VASLIVEKKLCNFESVVFGLWERFLTAITRSIVAAPPEKQRVAREATPSDH
jgi:hypothetical protein